MWYIYIRTVIVDDCDLQPVLALLLGPHPVSVGGHHHIEHLRALHDDVVHGEVSVAVAPVAGARGADVLRPENHSFVELNVVFPDWLKSMCVWVHTCNVCAHIRVIPIHYYTP